jgi:putative nucleotidyltransferase with HDIG domain
VWELDDLVRWMNATTRQYHSRRVAAYTIAILRKMGLPKDETGVIAKGALLHDIGKMLLPAEILLKADKLAAEEMAVMRQHSYNGYEMISSLGSLAAPAEIVYAHHEHYDGSGYPRGLQGFEIPLGARVVAIANTMDSITSDLPYRNAQSSSAAREEIQRWSGRQFDPRIVAVFLEIPAIVFEGIRLEIR